MATQNEEGRLSNDKAYNVVTKQYYTSQETRDSRYVRHNNSRFSFFFFIIGNRKIQELIVLFHLVLNPSHLEIGFNVTEGLEILCSFEQNISEGFFFIQITKHTNSNFYIAKKTRKFYSL